LRPRVGCKPPDWADRRPLVALGQNGRRSSACDVRYPARTPDRPEGPRFPRDEGHTLRSLHRALRIVAHAVSAQSVLATSEGTSALTASELNA